MGNIRLTDDPDEVDCRINKVAIALRTEFLKKVYLTLPYRLCDVLRCLILQE